MTRLVWFVAVGSAIGGASRLLLGTFLQQKVGPGFPLGTLIINVSGSFLLAFILRYATAVPWVTPEWRALLTTGFCGGYTTFSTYSFETATLLEDGRYQRAALYAALSVGVSLLATFGGFAAARELLALRESA
jgi:CrcB protein